MKISWIKSKNDLKSFELIKSFGGKVYELQDMEEIDTVMENLYAKEKCKTIVISNELASFSEDIIKKYKEDDQIRIIIASKK